MLVNLSVSVLVCAGLPTGGLVVLGRGRIGASREKIMLKSSQRLTLSLHHPLHHEESPIKNPPTGLSVLFTDAVADFTDFSVEITRKAALQETLLTFTVKEFAVTALVALLKKRTSSSSLPFRHTLFPQSPLYSDL